MTDSQFNQAVLRDIARLDNKIDNFIERTEELLAEVRISNGIQAQEHQQFKAALSGHETILREIDVHRKSVRIVAIGFGTLGGIVTALIGAAATYWAKT